jgi:integrase
MLAPAGAKGRMPLSRLGVVTGTCQRTTIDTSTEGCQGRRSREHLKARRQSGLRHTHAALALQAGIHPKVVSERLCHATVGVTLDTYSHAIPAMQEDEALLAGPVFVAEARPAGTA